MHRTTAKSEAKWHEKLNTHLSIGFWDKVFQIPKKMLVGNKLIWTQIQINKHLLPTNYTVNKYDNSVNPTCSFCELHLEELHSLMWSCGIVRQFWKMVENMLQNFFPGFVLGRREAIFGHSGSEGDSTFNTILMLSRYFIWKNKFTTKKLDEINYINYIKDQLELIYNCKIVKEKQVAFLEDWKALLEHFGICV